ncbi:MAG: alpha-L-fucosidase [Planctomycetes bacterium]|nr:alpha-L-fucosidase [Planctomycetota bacterium]
MIRTHRTPVVLVASILAAFGSAPAPADPGNKPERVAWFADLGFGLFIHWSLDSQIGSVISHSLAGADEAYCRRFFEELPRTFCPKRYDPDEWAVLAKLAGIRYVVFTAKHHSGFCMFETATTPFGIMNTPYAKDIAGQLIEAFRRRGIAIGLYFSPDDFWFLHRQGILIDRRRPGVTPQENPALMAHDRAQIRELLTRYGPIDILFIDGPAEGLRELAWEIQPDIVVTRGAIPTPEQYVPGIPIEGVWESCITMGTQWQYKPTNESYKSGTELIERLIETRAKGGNLLLNVGPRPDGAIPIEQEERLREIALWDFIDGEAVRGVEPWAITNEETIWFTKRRGEDTLYAIVTRPDWPFGVRRTITLRSVKVAPTSRIEILGQNGRVLEYRPQVDPGARWTQDDDGLHISAMRAQRIYNDHKWPNPVVIKITQAKPALVPPIAATGAAKPAGAGAIVLAGTLEKLGDAASVEVGFQVRIRADRTQPLAEAEAWRDTAREPRSAPGPFSLRVADLSPGREYEYRARVIHPRGVSLYGDIKGFRAPGATARSEGPAPEE